MRLRIIKKKEETQREVLNLREAGAFLGCSFRVLKSILDSGELPYRQVGGRFFISRSSLRNWADFNPATEK